MIDELLSRSAYPAACPLEADRRRLELTRCVTERIDVDRSHHRSVR